MHICNMKMIRQKVKTLERSQGKSYGRTDVRTHARQTTTKASKHSISPYGLSAKRAKNSSHVLVAYVTTVSFCQSGSLSISK